MVDEDYSASRYQNSSFLSQFRGQAKLSTKQFFMLWCRYDVRRNGFLTRKELEMFLAELLMVTGDIHFSRDDLEQMTEGVLMQFDRNATDCLEMWELTEIIPVEENLLFKFRTQTDISGPQFTAIWRKYDPFRAGLMEAGDIHDFMLDVISQVCDTQQLTRSKLTELTRNVVEILDLRVGSKIRMQDMAFLLNVDSTFMNCIKNGERLTRSEFGEFFDHYDSDLNGFIEGNELMLLMGDLMSRFGIELSASSLADTLGNVLDSCDVDGDGKINKEELALLFSHIDPETYSWEMSAKEGLLLWCQKKTSHYKNVNVQNFHTSFKDGLALCALIHRHRPDLLDYNFLRKDNAIYNLEWAFEVAERELDIPIMLDATEVAGTMRPDERAIMNYVSTYYHCFASSQQASQASNRVCKVLSVNQENESLMEEYQGLATGLIEWIMHMVPWIDSMREQRAGSKAEVTSRLEEFRTYRMSIKPPKTEEKGRLITEYNTLQTTLRLSNRPAFIPVKGRTIRDIDRAWDNLETVEQGVEHHLVQELVRLGRLEYLFGRFSLKCNSLAAWITEKKSAIKKDIINEFDLKKLLAKVKSDDAFDADMDTNRERLDQISNLSQDMVQQGFNKAGEVAARTQAMHGMWENLIVARTNYREELDLAKDKQEKISEMRLEFAKKVSPFNNWLEGIIEDQKDLLMCHSMKEVNSLITAHEEFKACLPEFHQEFADIQQAQQEIDTMATFGQNPFTHIDVEGLGKKWNELLQLIPERDQQLQDALIREKKKDGLRKEFGEHAALFAEWAEEEAVMIAESTMGTALSLHDQLEYLDEMVLELEEKRSEYQALEDLHKMILEEGIFSNAHTKHSMEGVRVMWAELHSSIKRQRNAVDNQILITESQGMTVEQVVELKGAFSHFDKNNDQVLDHFEFRACLVSMGFNVDTEEHLVNEAVKSERQSDFERMLLIADPDLTGHVTFAGFRDFIALEGSDQDTAEQIVNSFKVLARDKRYITPDDIRGELPQHQAEYCIARMGQYEGRDGVPGALDYMTFSYSLYYEEDYW